MSTVSPATKTARHAQIAAILAAPNRATWSGRRDAVLLAVVRDMTGQRRVVSVCETGPFPEPVVAKAQRELRAFGPGLEFHLHLLATSPAEQAVTVADLAIAQA